MYKMLIVDDERTERDCIRYLITSAGLPLELKEAPDAAAAMEILKDWPADILFTDVQMPVTTGLTLAKEAAALLPDIKILIFSSYAEFEYARTAMALGVESYILKPVVPKELEKTLSGLIQQLNEEYHSRLLQDKQQSYLLQYALHSSISKTLSRKFSQDIIDELNRFVQIALLDFPAPFLESNYTAFYENLRKAIRLDMETLNLSPTQALLFLRREYKDAYAFGCGLHSYITENYHVECYISISQPIKDHTCLQSAYAAVEQQMEQRFWNPKTTVFSSVHSGRPAQAQEELDDDSLLAAVKHSLSSKDAGNLQKNLNLLFQKYRIPSNQSQIFVKFVFSNLVTALYPFLPGQETEGKSGVKPLETLITELYIQQDILKIIDTVQTMAQEIIQGYDTNDANIRREILATQDYINKNYSSALSVEMLASQVYLTPDYLSRLFKKSTKKSLSQYIRQVRMEKASELLRTTTLKVIDVGIEVGYPNYSYFCQSFREYYGKSPEKYRREESYETNTSLLS